jgi:hypothetical protein
LLDIHTWQARNDSARAADQRELNELFTRLEMNQWQLMETLSMQLRSITPAPNSLRIDMHQNNMIAMIVSLQCCLETTSDEHQLEEWQFYAHTIQHLTTASGQHIELEAWIIVSLEVEFGHKIGSGGLYVCFQSYDHGTSTNCALH